jgi:hypothetical protein
MNEQDEPFNPMPLPFPMPMPDFPEWFDDSDLDD